MFTENAAKLWILRHKAGRLNGGEIYLTHPELIAFASIHSQPGETPEETVHRTAKQVANYHGVGYRFENRRNYYAIVFTHLSKNKLEEKGKQRIEQMIKEENASFAKLTKKPEAPGNQNKQKKR